MKLAEKSGKFLLPHGIILLGWWLRIFMEDNPYGIQNKSSFRIMELSVNDALLDLGHTPLVTVVEQKTASLNL